MNRAFKGVWIPKEIWLTKELTLQEKVFLVEISSLDNDDGCWAGNAYFADFFQLSKSRVSQIISSLEKKELIYISYLYKEDSKEIDKRIIRVNDAGLMLILGIEETKGGIKFPKGEVEETKGGYLENSKDNKLSENNTKNNTKNCGEPHQIIETKSKKTNKAKDVITMKGMINVFTNNDNIRDKLLEYFNIRVKKGLQPNQWQIILDDLRNFAGDDANIAIDRINNAIAGGYMQIIASWEKDKKNNNFSKPKFDNTAGRKAKAVVNMDEEEKKEFEDSLATDEKGNLLQF